MAHFVNIRPGSAHPLVLNTKSLSAIIRHTEQQADGAKLRYPARNHADQRPGEFHANQFASCRKIDERYFGCLLCLPRFGGKRNGKTDGPALQTARRRALAAKLFIKKAPNNIESGPDRPRFYKPCDIIFSII